ncbi:MAG: enoyl-CoA hydratase [Xanthomonadales bacterium]|nr:enoyl-CoA hydratase [Xanthomonadales bacterium]NNL95239.1 enoyl-CoA hydratase [Xanthomonadales bacterium]
MTETVVLKKLDGAVLTVTINRPDKLNALNQAVFAELTGVFAQAASDDSVRCVVLTGAGDKAFVAGADIAELRAMDSSQAGDAVKVARTLMRHMEQMGKPVIAAINGYALGGGCELALACTMRIASSKAIIGLPEITLGLIPGYGGTQRLTRLTGRGRALHMMLTGKPADAQQALDWGIVTMVTEPGELEQCVAKIARGLAASAPLSMRSIIDVVNSGADRSLDEGLDLEEWAFTSLFDSHDMREGTAAFLEKRKPEFTGQ